MRRVVLAGMAVGLLATSCLGGASERTVFVDYSHDQFASSLLNYFPNQIEAHPGDTVVFRQTWTGEPHSVTMGTIPDRLGEAIQPYLKIFLEKGYKGLPPEPPKAVADIEQSLPWMVKDNGEVAQNGAQPCFLPSGVPPKDQDKSCAKSRQRQPLFTGKQTYYNSGFIPYEGANGDTYRVKLAKTITPGRHFFYCNYHGEFMSGYLVVKPKSQKIASTNQVARQATTQINRFVTPLLSAFRQTQAGVRIPPPEAIPDFQRLGLLKTVNGKSYADTWFEGMGADNVDNAQINEFIPKQVTAKVGQKLTWVVLGNHTLSFNVPKYFPIIQVLKDGTVRRNPKLDPPAGGAPKPPSSNNNGPSNGPPKPTEIDAGSWSGQGFWSSGLIEAQSFAVYSLRITKPGTYNFACLVHPPMVGTLTVQP